MEKIWQAKFKIFVIWDFIEKSLSTSILEHALSAMVVTAIYSTPNFKDYIKKRIYY